MRQQNGQVVTFPPFASLLLCLTFAVVLSAIILALEAIIVMFTTEFAITNRRIIAKRGFIRRHTLEMFLHKIESVSVSQNVLQRLLNFGSVTVTGTGGTRESFRAIIDPVSIRRKINQVIEKYAQQSSAQ
ncbi:MAG: PH domain-containing protein [Anaerolineales bacterium]